MILFLVFLFLCIGLIVGSFLNVLIVRGMRDEKPYGRSHCESCGKTLSVKELIPLLSFLAQKGRCRACGTVLSWQYPIVELLTGSAFALAGWLFFRYLNIETFQLLNLFEFVLLLIAISACIVILVTDLRWQIIPNGAVTALAAIGILFVLFQAKLTTSNVVSLAWNISAAFLIALFFAALWFFSRGRWMGLGDAKLIFGTSLLVGFPASLAAFLFSFWLGGIVGAFLLILGKKGLQSRIPFGPFILIGTVLAYFLAPAFLRVSGLYFILS